MIRRAATPELIASHLSDPVIEVSLPSGNDGPIGEVGVVLPILAFQKRHPALFAVSDGEDHAVGRPACHMKMLAVVLPTGVDLDQWIDRPRGADMEPSSPEDPALTTGGFPSAGMPHVIDKRNERFLEVRGPFGRIIGGHAADVTALKKVRLRIDRIRHVLPIGPFPFAIGALLQRCDRDAPNHPFLLATSVVGLLQNTVLKHEEHAARQHRSARDSIPMIRLFKFSPDERVVNGLTVPCSLHRDPMI
mgnify:CR=1 FL=1